MHFLVMLSMVFWGFNWVWSKLISQDVSTAVILFYRFFFSTIGFFLILLFRRLSLRISLKDLGWITLCSMLMGLYQWCFFKGLHVGLAGAGGVLTTTLNPILTFFVSALIFRKRLTLREWIGLGLGLSSAVLFLHLWRLDWAVLAQSGNIFFLLAALVWAFVSLVSHRVQAHALVYSFYVFVLATPFFLIGVPNLGGVWYLGRHFWFNFACVVGLGTLFSTTHYFSAAQQWGAKRAASYFFMVPASAVIFSFFVMGEVPTWTTLLGGVLALSGVSVLNMTS